MPAGSFSRLFFAALVAAAGPAALAGPPGLDALGRGDAKVDRALQSRSEIMTRAAGRGSAAATAARPELGAGAGAAAQAAGAAGTHVTSPGRADAAINAAEASGRARGLSPDVAGRVGPDLRSGARVGIGRDRTGVETGMNPSGRGDRPRFGLSWRGDRPDTAGNVRLDGTAKPSHGGRAAVGPVRAGTWSGNGPAHAGVVAGNGDVATVVRGKADVRPGAGRTLSHAERLLANRLAQIDRMRDRAVETGDEALLRQADRLEVLARAQFEQRTTGEASVGTAMRTFNEEQRTVRRDGTDPAGDDETDAPTDTRTGDEITPTGLSVDGEASGTAEGDVRAE